MKRSAQVALLLGGLTAAGAGAYALTPPRRDCPPAPAVPAPQGTDRPTVPLPIPGVAPGREAVTPGASTADPCARQNRWGRWGSWTSGGSRSRASRSYWPSSSTRTSSPPAARTTTTTSRTSPSRTTTTTTRTSSRGGFGSTGRSVSRSS